MALRNRLLSSASALIALSLPFTASTAGHAQEGRSWTGFHVGIGGALAGLQGYLAAYAEDEYCDKFCDSYSLSGAKDFFDGTFGGFVRFGYDVQSPGGLVVGFAADYELLANYLEGEGLVDGVYDQKDAFFFPELDFFGATSRSAFSFTGRIGFTPNPQSLVYLLGGVTLTHYELGGEYRVGDKGSFSWYDSGMTFGPTAGFGIEAFIGTNATIGLEYRATLLPPLHAQWMDLPEYGYTDLTGIRHSIRASISFRPGNQ